MQNEEITLLKQRADEVSALLGCLANSDRLLLLCALAENERNVSELAEITGIVQPTLSQQLTVLRKEGIVQTRRDGKYVYYRLEHEQVVALMQSLYHIFCAHKEQS